LETVFAFTANDGAFIGWLGVAIAALTGALFVAYSIILLWELFFRRHAPAEQAHVRHAPSFLFLAPVAALVLIGAAIPFVLGVVEIALFASPASAIAGNEVEAHLALWHGLTPAFLTSLAAIAAGAGIFLMRNWVREMFAQAPAWLDGVYWFDWVINSVNTLAGWTTRTVQGGSLEHQVSITLLCAFGAVVYALFQLDFIVDLRANWATLPSFTGVVLSVLAIMAALVTVRMRDALSSIISIGVVGVVVTLFFAGFGAPDLALTQLLIEVLTVVLLVLVFYRIPPHIRPSFSRLVRLRNVLVAGAVGLGGFVLVLLSIDNPLLPSISPYFSLNALPAAHGGNIVNVILVDFRGFDTLGEITVLTIAALGGYALLRASRLQPATQQRRDTRYGIQDTADLSSDPPNPEPRIPHPDKEVANA
jgi:multisubunit Na+/H+ antiporter MnhB subunit